MANANANAIRWQQRQSAEQSETEFKRQRQRWLVHESSSSSVHGFIIMVTCAAYLFISVCD